MAVTTENNRTDELTTDGVETDFDFAMLIHADTEVRVWYEPDGGSYDQLALNTDYGVVFTEDGGTVGTDGYRAPLAAGKVLIIRHLELTQQTNWLYLDNHSEQQHQDDFDRSAMRDIQIQEQLDRVLMLAIHSSTTGITCPEPVANYLLGWNAGGTNLTNISPLAIAVLIAEEVIAGSIPEVLTDLTDVSFDAPAAGDVLRHDGGQWTKYADSNYQPAADGLDDISALAKTDSYFIVGNGTQWVAESGATVRTSLGLDSIIATLVPYAGATGNVNLGEKHLITDGRVYGDLHTQGFDFNSVTGIQVFGAENSAFKPEHDNNMSCGDPEFKWKSIASYAGNFSTNVIIGGFLNVTGKSLFSDKIKFTQVDGNEFIDSLADGYVDYGATTAHRFNNDVTVAGDITTSEKIISTGGGETGKFLTGLAGNTVFSFSGDNFDIRAGSGSASSQNVMRVTQAGDFDFKAGSLTTTGTGTFADLTISTSGEINFRDSDISIGSTLFDGVLDMSADDSICMFYDNADVGDAVDGQSLDIYRRAAEGDDYLQFYISSDRYAIINASQTLKIQRQGSTKILVDNNDVFITGGLGIGVSSIAANSPCEIYSPFDVDSEIFLRAGVTVDVRNYFVWKDHLDDKKWLLGRNNNNDFIIYDEDNGLHCFKHFDGGITHIASGGSSAVTINWIDTAGTGGVLIYDGGASPALIYSITPTAFHSYTDTMHLDNATGTTTLEVESGNADTLLHLHSAAAQDSQISFAVGADLKYYLKYDAGNDRFDIWDDDSSKGITIKDGLVGINDTTPSFQLDIKGTLSVSNTAYLTSNVIMGGGGYVTLRYGTEIRFVEPGQSAASYTGFKAPALAANIIYTLPTADGAANEFLQTDGSGALSWATAAEGGAVGIATGSYTGDGTESQGITGVGFQPVYVRIVQKATVPSTAVNVFWTSDVIIDDHADKATIAESSGVSQMLTKKIISLDALGFTVSDAAGDLDPNKDGVDYNYVAFGP